MSIKYTAKFNGQTFVRRSKRDASKPYSHVILVKESAHRRFEVSFEIAKYSETAEEAQDKFNRSYSAYVELLEAGNYDQYIAHGWAGRPDLALRQLEALRVSPYYSDVQAIPAELTA